MPRPREGVSIPFEREGVCKVDEETITIEAEEEFQFPSSGRCMQRHRRGIYMFDKIFVSIPFEREGVCKDILKEAGKLGNARFNSLRAGRCMQRIKDQR